MVFSGHFGYVKSNTHFNLTLCYDRWKNTTEAIRILFSRCHFHSYAQNANQSIKFVNLPSDFVAERFGWDDGNFLTNTFVCMEIHGQSSVVFLDDDLWGLLDSLRTNATLQNNVQQLQLPSLFNIFIQSSKGFNTEMIQFISVAHIQHSYVCTHRYGCRTPCRKNTQENHI